jgi:hypothetical protein
MEEQISPEKAIEFMIKHSKEFASAKAARIYLEEFRKSKKAILMQQAAVEGFSSAVTQEREAYAHPEYQKLLTGLKDAVEIEETLRWKLTAAQARIDVWRSREASNRTIDKLVL